MGCRDIYSVKLPSVVDTWEVSGTEVYAIKGIEEEYYKELNKSLVRKLPRNMTAKRRVINKITREFKKDEEGKYIYEDYKVPSGSVVVTSEKTINLPYSLYSKSDKGYGYIDFCHVDGKLLYIYVLPREVLYRVHQTALALSVKTMKGYAGYGYKTWKEGVIYLHVIPYSPNSTYAGSKILKTGITTNYLKEIEEIVNFWQENNIMPKISLCELQSGENLALKPINICYDSYTPIEMLPLSDKEIFGEEDITNEK